MSSTHILHPINAATATAASGWIPVTGACKVQIVGKRSAHSAGSTAFSVQVAVDEAGTAATAYSKLIDNVTNTNAQQLTRVASKSLAANGTCLLSMSPEDIGGFIKVTATETTDGTHDAWVIISYS